MWNLFKKEKEEVKAQELQSKIKAEPEKIFTTIDAEGLYVYSPEDMINSDEFKPLVDKISIAMGGDNKIFERYLKPSILQVALYAQKIPAAESVDGRPSNIFGHHMSEGGLLLHSLETMYFALNDSRLAFFNKGVTPSQRAQHLISARVACGLAGLLHDIGKINDPIIVTYKEENGVKKEYRWKCVEPISEFLARVHNLDVSKVFKNKENKDPPTYIIKGWKKGRSDKHMFIGPFLMRNFLSKATMKLISQGDDNLLTDFMTCIDWDVLSGEYTQARINAIYRIMNGADKTSSTRDRKALSNTNSIPLEATTDTRNKIIDAFQYLTDSAEVAVNQSANCYIYSHATPNNSPTAPQFVLLIRCDEPAFGMFCKVFAKASEFAKTDVLQEHEPNFKNFIELLKQCDMLLPAPTADGKFTVVRNTEVFKAICIRNWNNVIRPNGRLYRAQENDFLELKLKFGDGVEPEIKSKKNTSNTEPDLKSDLTENQAKDTKIKDSKPTEKTVDTVAEKQSVAAVIKEHKTVIPLNGNSASSVTENSEKTVLSEAKKTVTDVAEVADTPTDENEHEPTDEELLDGAQEVTEEENIPKAPSAFNSTKSFIPVLNKKISTVEQKSTTDVTVKEPEKISKVDSIIADKVNLIKETAELDVNPATLVNSVTKKAFEPTVPLNAITDDQKTQIIEEDIEKNRPQVYEEDQIRNFDKAIHDEKEHQKIVMNEQRKNAMRNKDFPNTEPDTLYSNPDEPWFEGIKTKAVMAIKDLCKRIEQKDPKVAKTFSLQICNRLHGKFSYIDFVTVDNHYCYAVFLWNDEIKKDANAVQLIKSFQKNDLFPTPYNEIETNTMEIFYFGHIQMIRAVTKIFFLADFTPLKVNCREHPYEKIYHKPVTGTALIEFLKHRIISLEREENFYGYKCRGYAHEALGRRINKAVLKACYTEYADNSTGFTRMAKMLTLTKQITPPYMIIDGDDLVVGYKKPLRKEDVDAMKEEEKKKQEATDFAMPFAPFAFPGMGG